MVMNIPQYDCPRGRPNNSAACVLLVPLEEHDDIHLQLRAIEEAERINAKTFHGT